jgi:predicted ATPase
VLPTDEVAGEARYGMLDTIRDYAKDRLAAFGEQLRIGIRQRNYLLRMVEETVSAEFGSDGHVLIGVPGARTTVRSG